MAPSSMKMVVAKKSSMSKTCSTECLKGRKQSQVRKRYPMVLLGLESMLPIDQCSQRSIPPFWSVLEAIHTAILLSARSDPYRRHATSPMVIHLVRWSDSAAFAPARALKRTTPSGTCWVNWNDSIAMWCYIARWNSSCPARDISSNTWHTQTR